MDCIAARRSLRYNLMMEISHQLLFGIDLIKKLHPLGRIIVLLIMVLLLMMMHHHRRDWV